MRTAPTVSRSPLARALMGLCAASALAAATLPLAGCAPLVLGGAALGSGLVFTDRRTSGAQLEDEAIELKASARARDVLGDKGHVNATSYNRLLLLTGEVPTDADREAVAAKAGAIENVTSVVNELTVSGNSSLGSRSSDALITSRVKASYIDAKDIQANVIKVVTERGVVHLMGRVTEREAARAAELARTVPGVLKVVRVFEMLSEAELAKLQTR